MHQHSPTERHRPNLRATLTATVLAGALLLSAATASAVLASSSPRLCGYFMKRGQDVIVYHAGPVKCGKAKTIIKAFFTSKDVTQHGTTDADSYWTIKGFPGWKCQQSMGEGGCRYHSAAATYQIKA
jgi:uncharacterized low-complexity protein